MSLDPLPSFFLLSSLFPSVHTMRVKTYGIFEGDTLFCTSNCSFLPFFQQHFYFLSATVAMNHNITCHLSSLAMSRSMVMIGSFLPFSTWRDVFVEWVNVSSIITGTLVLYNWRWIGCMPCLSLLAAWHAMWFVMFPEVNCWPSDRN